MVGSSNYISRGARRQEVAIELQPGSCEPIRTSSRSPTVLADQVCHACLDLVADRAHGLDGLSFRVFERPVDPPEAWDIRASLAAAHRHEEGCTSGHRGRQELRLHARQIEPEL